MTSVPKPRPNVPYPSPFIPRPRPVAPTAHFAVKHENGKVAHYDDVRVVRFLKRTDGLRVGFVDGRGELVEELGMDRIAELRAISDTGAEG